MTTTSVARQPRGIPVGGQFAPTAHAEPSAALTVEDRLTASITERHDRSTALHVSVHDGLTSNALGPHEEAHHARQAVDEALACGDFGADTLKVRELSRDDRLVRHAVDRYVVTDQQDPGAFEPAQAGHRLGRILMELQDEDIEDALYRGDL